MFFRTALTAALAAIGVSATSSSDSLLDSRRQMPSPELHVRDSSSELTGGHPAMVVKRQSASATSPFTLVANPPQNETAWNEVTNAACAEALSKLSVATNPSGTCVCYNLPALDTNTGVFQADLRLYKVSEPRDQFIGILAENIQVGLSYSGASVSQAGQSAVQRRGMAGLFKRETPTLLQTYTFVGQMDQDEMALTNGMTMATIEALVMPVVTLTGSNGGNVVSTNISMNEASFVVGVFSDQVVLSSTAMAQLQVDKEVAGLNNGTVIFQVPGIRIMIFPVGLIITSIWVVLFAATVGYGTVQRMQYREQFRRRTAMVSKGGVGTI